MTYQGLFVGLATLDLIYQSEQLPGKNQKLVACDYLIAAGGPATNASVAFSYLGNPATLLGVVGKHPMTHLIYSDLEQHCVRVEDLNADWSASPPISSIITTPSTGDRAVISINATRVQVSPSRIPQGLLSQANIVLIDGHQMAVGAAIAQQAKAKKIPVVIDGGSWKPGYETVLPFVDYAICSANFYPPGCSSQAEVFAYLKHMGIPHIAITQGEKPIVYRSFDQNGQIPVPKIQAVDTLGAGDIFHGAFCHYILQTSFLDSLTKAAQIAARSCQFFGSRQWMKS